MSCGSRGTTLLLTTHYMDEAEQLCDRVVIMDNGRIIRDGPPGALVLSDVGREVLELRMSPEDRARLEGVRLPGATVQVDGDLVQIAGDDAEALHDEVRRHGLAGDLQAARRATLEDVFLRITGRHLRDDD